MITESTLYFLLAGVAMSILFVFLGFKLLWYMMGTFIGVPGNQIHYLLTGVVLDAFVLAMLMEPFIYRANGLEVSEKLEFFTRIPFAVWYLYCIGSILMTIHVRHRLVQWRKSHVTNKTLHQALDNLPMGVCVYNSKGVLQMANYQMQSLCRKYTGAPLLNGISWEKEILRLPDLMIHFSDEDVWHFHKFSKENDITVLTANNVTEEMKLNKELQRENVQLEGMNLRMRQYGLNLEDIIKQEELLNTQIRVHDDLGHILLTSKVFMNGSDFAVSEKQLRREWKKLLLSMKDFQDTASDDSQISDLIKAAGTLGIDIVVDGKLPSNQTMRHLLASAARECLTNAAKADAKRLWIKIEKPSAKQKTTRISYTNDGNPPVGPVVEGVGLGTLRQIVEREGAVMTITSDGAFRLTIEM